MSKKPTYNELEERVKRLEKKVRSYEELKDILIAIEGSCCRLQEASFEGLSVCEEGIILEANRAMSTITGYEAQELIGMDVLSLFTPEWRDFVEHNIVSMFDKSYEAICLKKDTTRIPVEIQGKSVDFLNRKQPKVPHFRYLLTNQ